MTALYRGMDRAELDKAYDNTNAVADVQTIVAGFRSRSEQVYASTPCERDMQYGDQPRECFDLFRGRGVNPPTMIYLHGGYWQARSKEDFSFVAEGALELGYNVVLAEYTLAPQASMTQIVQEVGQLLDHLMANRDQLSLGHGPVCLVGHSAGGHLSLLHRSHPLLSHTMAISPLVDLEPISLCWLNDKLQLTPGEIDKYSPLRHIGTGTSMTMTVGLDELPELVRHASDFAATAVTLGEDVDLLAIDQRNHFTILEELACVSGVLAKALKDRMSPR